MLDAIAFYTLAALILAFAIAVITARNPVHSVVFLVINFLAVAIVYIVLGAEFLAMIQVLVYAGGIVVLYLFVVMLVNLKRGPEAHQDPRRRTKLGFGLAVAGLGERGAVGGDGSSRPGAAVAAGAGLAVVGTNDAGGVS